MLRQIASGGELNWRKDEAAKSSQDFDNPVVELFKEQMIELFSKYQIIEPKRQILIVDRLKRCLIKRKVNVILFGQFVAAEGKLDETVLENALSRKKNSRS